MLCGKSEIYDDVDYVKTYTFIYIFMYTHTHLEEATLDNTSHESGNTENTSSFALLLIN